MTRESGAGEYLLLGLGGLSYMCYTYIWFTLPALLSPIIDEFALSTTEAGLIVGAVPLMYVPLGLFSGLLIDRLGAKSAITIGLVVFGIVQLARGIAGSFTELLIPTLILGIAGMTMTFGLPKLVSELFPANRAGTMTSVYQIGSQLGPVAAFGLSRPFLEPVFGSWRPIFLISGAIVLGFSAVWIIAVIIYNRTHQTPAVTPDADAKNQAFTIESARNDLSKLFSHRDMLLLVLVGTMYLYINHGLRGWLAVILETTGLTPELAGLLTSLLVIAQISGTISIPPLSDRFNRRKAALALCGTLCAIGTTGLLIGPGGVIGSVVVVWILGMGLGALSPMIKLLPIEMEGIGTALTATAVSFVYAVGEIGGFGGPFAIGALHDATGTFEVGIITLIVGSLVIIGASFAMTQLE